MSGTKGPIAIRGITPDDRSKPPARIELRDMRAKNPDQWNLFLLGMERFMDPTKEKEPDSFYQIAGIHGMPYYKWPNQDWNKETAVDSENGYCTHSSVLFLTWHRPYLALFEQVLYKHVNDIAHEYGPEPEERKDAYIKAARDFRLPYWDWARQTSEDVTLFPIEAWAVTKLQVTRPKSKGVSKPLDFNPLSGYRFGEKGRTDQAGQINRYPKAGKTLRYPDTSGTSNDQSVIDAMLLFVKGKEKRSRGKNLTERVLWILKSYTQYGSMCCNLFASDEPNWNGWGSLEDIHNAAHVYVGGGGQMSQIETSAFDPIFWLHHNNIDRLFALWQALHDDDISNPTFVKSSSRSQGTRMIAEGSGQDKDTPLAPFTASETIGDFWTSTKAKSTKTFGYVYPETQDWLFKTKEDIIKELDRLYRTGSFPALMKRSGIQSNSSLSEIRSRAVLHKVAAETPLNAQVMLQTVKTDSQLPVEIEQHAASISLPDRKFEELVGEDNKYLEWLVDIKAEKHANGGDFIVHVFLGQPEDVNPAIYLFNPTHVASFSTMGQNEATSCTKCQVDQNQRLQVTGQIPLTMALIERYIAGQIDGLDVGTVEPWLAENLHWRVTTRGGQILQRSSIPGLLVGVVTNEVTLPFDESGMPQYASSVVPRPAATTKRQIGIQATSQAEGRGEGTGYTGGNL